MKASFLILVAEDDENDAFLLKRALKRAGVLDPVYIVGDGQQVIEYLDGTGKYKDRKLHPLPQLAIFDIKMPRRDGFEALQWARQQKCFEHLPILMHSSSGELCDITRAYELGANAYLIKGAQMDDWSRTLGGACRFWNAVANAPEYLAA